MKIVSRTEFENERDGYINQIKSGLIFVYPTDTIYGIGCNALLTSKVNKIRDIKNRPTKPFSIIVPSVEWIYENCVVNEEIQEWIDKLPGPYTLILKLKNPDFLSKDLVSDTGCIGVRLPDHWIRSFVAELGYPIVTTSVNQQGRVFMTALEDIDPEIEKQVELIIDEGELKGNPSKIVSLCGEPTIIRQ